jgi:hypothetical protein
MTRIELAAALTKLLADSEAWVAARGVEPHCEPPTPEQLGNGHEHIMQVIRRLGSGQVVAISPRVVKLIIAELMKP